MAAQRHKPHAILTAIASPSNGVEVLNRLRVDKSFDGTPIFAVTGFVSAGDRVSLLNVGFAAVFGRPLPLDFLADVESRLPK